MSSSYAVPVPEEVGALYDRFTDLGDAALGRNLHFGYWSDDEDAPETGDDLEEATQRFTDEMIRRLRVGPGGRMLDVGCGVGGPAVRVARTTGVGVLGVTVSAEQVRRATELAAAEGLSGQAEFRLTDVMELGLPDRSFDAAWALESLCHVPDRLGALRNIARALRPGARFVLTDFYLRRPLARDEQAAVDAYFRDFMMGPMVGPEGYPALFSQAGMRFVEQLDISAETLSRTFRMMSDNIARQKAELEGAHGAEMVDQFDPATLVAVDGLGYLLAVAERMDTDLD